MPPLVRILPQFAVGRRAYSFFSSKSGGGRYFNPAKASKAIAPTTTTPARSTQSVDASISPTSSELAEGSERVSQPTPATLSTVDAVEHEALSPSSLAEQLQASRLTHPMLKPHEFKLHHFFALHRPYLLLNQPTSALFETAQATQPSAPFVATIDNPPEASAEADADAARQLSRALVVNRVGNTVDWDVTLQRLGISASDVVGPTEEANVLLDSTKRKRRRKMKKHK